MWTLEAVNAYALARGELQNQRDAFRAALLAQERARGRLERPYPEKEATAEFEIALDRLGSEVPSPREGEYPGLEELRDQVLARQRSQQPEPLAVKAIEAYTGRHASGAENEEDEDERDR